MSDTSTGIAMIVILLVPMLYQLIYQGMYQERRHQEIMEGLIKFKGILLLFALFLTSYLPTAGQAQKNEIYLATELNNVVCGYSRIVVYDSIINNKKVEILEQNTFNNFFALGSEITQHQVFNYYIDPSTGNFIYHDSYHKQGEEVMRGAMYVEDDLIRISSPDTEDIIISDLPADLIIPNTQFYPYLRDDFASGKLDSTTYPVFNVRTGRIEETRYWKIGEEKAELAGKLYDAVILEQADPASGQRFRIWIDKNSGMRIKMEVPPHVNIYLADASIIGNIKTGNWDALFFTETNVSIGDIRSISRMKVKAKLEPFPHATLEDLNFPGQTFTGQAGEHGIEGVFEIAHQRYNGRNAPEFPLNADRYKAMGPYLEAAELIESDDPVLVALAGDICAGSENLWVAATRISQWIATNIDGSILDGTARETYDAGSGLCGAQSSLMTALCRAAGIPARTVWGCLYITEYGGSFGHHAWNEVFMGENGWIPLDVTIHETDYVDSGHIRFGVRVTRQTRINSWSMEILDYRL